MLIKELEEKILVAVKDNHIWLNAYSCIRPTDEFLIELGRTIIDKLRSDSNLLPSYVPGREQQIEEVHKLSEISPTLYLSVNKS